MSTTIDRRQFFAASALGLATARAQAQPGSPPDIVLILADDLGYGDLGCYGQKLIQTPSLDRMAAEGMRFTQAYAGSTVCAPSRCCLMTGLHTGHARTRGNKYPDLPLRPEDITVAELLKQAGYRTGLFGKWSLGTLGTTGYPLRKGFDEWFGFFSQTHAHNSYPEHLLDNESAYLLRGNMGAKRTEYANDLFTDRALRFIRQADNRPYFLHLCYTIPHANNEMGRDTGNGMEAPSLAPYESAGWPAPEKGFAAMITRMDRDIGRLLDAIRGGGQGRSTLVIFTSDNGPHNEGGHSSSFFSSSGGLRGIKRDLYEGGIRVPALAWAPGVIPAGRVNDQVWAGWDFPATACKLAGTQAPRGLDGSSIDSLLIGGQREAPEFLYWEFHERDFGQAARTGDWKGVRIGGKPIELYDLAKDPAETHDIAAENPGVVRQMEEIMRSARTESAEWPTKRN